MKIRWTAQAADDLVSVHKFLAKDSSRAANKLVDTILSEIDTLERFPSLGRTGRVQGTKELVIAHIPYIVAYRWLHGHIEILGVLHGARKWTPSF